MRLYCRNFRMILFFVVVVVTHTKRRFQNEETFSSCFFFFHEIEKEEWGSFYFIFPPFSFLFFFLPPPFGRSSLSLSLARFSFSLFRPTDFYEREADLLMASVTAQLSAFLQCGASSHLIEQYLKERERERERKKKKKRQRTTSVGQHLSLSLSSSYKGVFGLRWPRPLSAAGSDRSCPTPRPLMDGRPAGHLRSVRPPFVSVR